MLKYLFVTTLFVIACAPKDKSLVTESYAQTQNLLIENTTHLQDISQAPFYHGVASGDPYKNSVLIWTRITPQIKTNRIDYTWEISTDKSFSSIINKGSHFTTPDKDYTVKVIADKLEPGTLYFYRFKSQNKFSPIGQCKTLPIGDAEVNFAVVSCSNIEFGFFNAYNAICDEDVDAVIHLGDYIYEYGPGIYGDTSFIRKNIPAHEIITIQDYRDRYSQYRLDKDLQKIHGQFAFINVWDDHEITNNAYVTGAQNHQPDEGSYQDRKNVAKQVYYEWLPIRENKNHYRKFEFGNTVELIMLDERLAGRTEQPDSLDDPRRLMEDHTLLGNVQMEWLTNTLSSSDCTWKVLGNQVTFSYCDWGHPTFRHNMDAWDGYPKDQEILARAVQKNNIENLVFVTGDTHTAWAFEATPDPKGSYNQNTSVGAIGVEFGVTSITSGNSNERYATNKVKQHEKTIVNTDINPHLKYANMRDHGYLLLKINEKQLKADYRIVSTLKSKDFQTTTDKSFIVKKGSPKLLEPLRID